MKKILAKYLWPYIIFIPIILWGLLIYVPSVFLPYTLIDDGHSALVATELAEGIENFDGRQIQQALFEPEVGRVRPGYWLMQSSVVGISAFNSHINHFWRLSLLVITCFLMVKLLRWLKVADFWQALAVFFFITNAQNFENYYRLGPVEPYLGVLFMGSVYLIVSTRLETWKHVGWVGILLALACFTKETFFLTAGGLMLWAGILYKGRTEKSAIHWQKLIVISGTMLAVGTIVFLIKSSYPEIATYADNYKFSVESVKENAKNYLHQILQYQQPMLYVIVLGLLAFAYRYLFLKLQASLSVVGLLGFLIVMAIGHLLLLLPWGFVLGRYLLLVNICLVLLFAWSAQQLETMILQLSFLPLSLKGYVTWLGYSLILLVTLVTFFTQNLFEIANFQLWQKHDAAFAQSMLNGLNTTIPQNSVVLANYIKGDANIEIFLEAGWHLRFFHDRKDIQFAYLDNESLCTQESRYILDRKSERFIPRESIASVSAIVASDSAIYDPVNREVVIRSFIKGYKLTGWSNEYPFDWTIFKQEPHTCIQSETYEEI